ncbi:MAG: hypothetical protein V1865_00930 [bacterium]
MSNEQNNGLDLEKIEEKVKEGVETAVEFAKDVNEKYDLENKARVGATMATEYAKEVKEKYDHASPETKEKVKKGVLGGIAAIIGLKVLKKIIKK